MATKFSDFLVELDEEAWDAGPEAVAEFEALRLHYRKLRKLLLAEKRKMTKEITIRGLR